MVNVITNTTIGIFQLLLIKMLIMAFANPAISAVKKESNLGERFLESSSDIVLN
jgi:hypothetical protein